MRHVPLVLLHGFTGALASYDAVLAKLRTYRSERTFTPYLLGYGSSWAFSPVEPAAPDFAREVDALAEQLRGFGIGPDNPCTVVGYSLGARLALGLLVARRTWFNDAVLVGVNPGLADAGARTTRRSEDEARAVKLETRGLAAFLSAWQAMPLFESQRALPSAVLDAQHQLRQTHTAAGLAYSLRHTGLGVMPDYVPRLVEIRARLHLVVGEHDAKFRLIAEQMRRVVPKAELAVVPGVGHNVPLEAPTALAALLDALPED